MYRLLKDIFVPVSSIISMKMQKGRAIIKWGIDALISNSLVKKYTIVSRNGLLKSTCTSVVDYSHTVVAVEAPP